MNTNEFELVEFEKYCYKCKHESVNQFLDPCDKCLGISARQYSHKPEYFEEKEE